MSHWTNTLMVVTNDFLLTARVLELVPDAVLDLEALQAAAICPEMSDV
jgi:hypothetical protein